MLAFEVGSGCLGQIYKRYSDLHPNLLPNEYKQGVKKYDNEACMFEVFAYYQGEENVSSADEGTRLRFVEPIQPRFGKCVLPGMCSVDATFQDSCQPAYFDHWVSNGKSVAFTLVHIFLHFVPTNFVLAGSIIWSIVISRTGFLQTLQDVLSFTPKVCQVSNFCFIVSTSTKICSISFTYHSCYDSQVDFNAGVVAAGEAQIESTVTGNDSSKMSSSEKDSALKDQSQIYLPINNAITEVGHVSGFLKEYGQGVQHIASRVGDIIGFVQQANDRRKMFGEVSILE